MRTKEEINESCTLNIKTCLQKIDMESLTYDETLYLKEQITFFIIRLAMKEQHGIILKHDDVEKNKDLDHGLDCLMEKFIFRAEDYVRGKITTNSETGLPDFDYIKPSVLDRKRLA